MRPELPKKWCVKITKDNSSVLEDWRKEQPHCDLDEAWICNNNIGRYLVNKWNDNTYLSFSCEEILFNHMNFKEITFEEFEILVLGRTSS